MTNTPSVPTNLDNLDVYFGRLQSAGATVLSNATQAKRIIDKLRDNETATPVEPEPAPAPVVPAVDGWSLDMTIDQARDWYAANTGPRHKLEGLTVHEGRLNIRDAGTVVKGMRITGHVNVYAPNVQLLGCDIPAHVRFHEGADNCLMQDTAVRHAGAYVVRNSGAHNLVLDHCEIDGEKSPANNGGVVGGNVTVRWCDFHSHTDSAKYSHTSLWEYNWMHGNGRWLEGVHVDGLQTLGATNTMIRRNLIQMVGFSSCIHSQATNADLRDVTVEENYLNGGSFSVYMRSDTKGYDGPINCLISNNRMGRDYLNGPFSTRLDTTVVGNRWADTGELV